MRTNVLQVAAGAVLVGLLTTGCTVSLGGNGAQGSVPVKTAQATPATDNQSAPESTPVATPAADAAPAEQAGSVVAGSAPAWATGVTNVGTVVGAVDVNGLHVELRYAGTRPASITQTTYSGDVVYAAGDPIQFLDVTVTNTSGATIALSPGLVEVDLGALIGETSGAPYRELGINHSAVGQLGVSDYPIAAGESYSFAASTPTTGQVEAVVSWREPATSTVHEASTSVQLP